MILSKPKINLAEYLEEAILINNILLGLENITELLDSDNSNNIPYYHCNLEDCYNEQGKARQIDKHINSYSHKQAWIRQTKQLRLSTREDINDWLRNNHVDQQSFKTIAENSMWDDCRQSLLRSQEIFEYFKDSVIDFNQIQTKSPEIQLKSKPNIQSQTSPRVIQAESPTKLTTSMVTTEENISENLSATNLSANELRSPDKNQGLAFSVSVDELLGDKSDSEAMNSDDNSPFPNTQFSDSAFGEILPEPQTVGNIGSHTDIGASSEQQQIFENIEADQPLADQPPEVQPLADQPLADQPLADQPPADQPPADQPPADQPPADQTPADQPPADQTPADQPPSDQLPAQQPRAAKRRPFPKPMTIKVEPGIKIYRNLIWIRSLEYIYVLYLDFYGVRMITYCSNS